MDERNQDCTTRLGFVVNDIQEKVRVWAEMLNVKIPDIITSDKPPKSISKKEGYLADVGGKRALFFLENIMIELFEPDSDNDSWHMELDCKGESIRHIVFFRKNMTEKIVFLRQHDGLLAQQRE
ncbi:hypothetical protein EH223_11125 [candidate division KSB1 bacterium]|nr:VOC family protein [candidate division KSB1 bacterium]RQW03043.1 MAG: hypothetical protein EH223_11125 [candidate division KSB1 bacterium]